MKNIILILIIGILLCFSCENAMAQAPYKASVGGVLPSLLATGVSAKALFTDKFAFQADLLYKVTLSPSFEPGGFAGVYPALEINTNVMYQKKLKEQKKSELFWFIGGGVSLGSTFTGNGKLGVNAIIGLEYVFVKKPLAIQIDLRPGYGMLFHSGENLNSGWFTPDTNPWHHFDWMVGFTIRRTFNKKGVE